VFGQTYVDSVNKHRQAYKQEFIDEERSPLKGNDTSFLRFYKPDAKYRVVADVKLTPDSKTFDIPTHSGKKKSSRKYADLSFKIDKKAYKLEVYQSPDLMKNPKYSDHLFIPFNDLTNYEETYGGGRYIDLSLNDVKDGKVVLDFNKCYNPYCAYSDGYNCPIPPDANRLKVAIKAGEKNFGKVH
jgi:uncharacterized protein (DUF1684 family)